MRIKVLIGAFITLIIGTIISLICVLEIPRLAFTYDEKTDSYILTNVYGSFSNLVIPTYHNDKKVSSIGREAFLEKDNIKEISFEEDSKVKTIESGAFSFMPDLVKISLPSSLEVIDNNAFYGCSLLKEVSFKDDSKLNIINGLAFAYCPLLEELSLPSGIRSIGSYAFYNSGIKKLYIANATTFYEHALDSIPEENIIYY